MVGDTDNPFRNNLFSNHFLKERIDELEEWQEADLEDRYLAFVKLYENNQRLLGNSPNEDRTWDNFTRKVFKKILGHYDPQSEPRDKISGTEYNPDYTLFEDKTQFVDAQENDEEFDVCYAIVENKKWDRKLDKSAQDHTNPAFQTYNYVDRLRVPWGILTNGKKWRLYSYEDCEADTFFQIDVVEDIVKEDDREIALRNFKYFYLFFSTEAFLPKQNGFADKVLKGSFNYAQSLEEDLEDRIYTALEETSRGFFDFNDLEKTEENVDLVHRSSLILLYRLLFVLNAESRELLPVSEDLYRNKLSLAHFREHLREEDENVFDEYDWAWDRLTRLFKAIDDGKEYGDYKITAYNGGLFRYPENADEDEEIGEENKFLANHKLRGTKLKEILKLLAVSEDEEGEEVLVDYKDLNIRHLGSVYEGLLEHELQVAEEDLILDDGEWTSAEDSSKDFSEAEETVEEGQVYITNESGERKATGSYYTPEYIVEYIVENTVKPKVEEKIEEADSKKEVLDKVLELNICDPAMGSGHFLTIATSFIAHKIAEEAQLNGEVDDENEIVWLKRQVVQNCIYGVDINPLATELAKLSLWIETMSKGKPLSFLDHHLKVGNSLIGSDFENIFSHPTEKQKKIDNERFKFGTPEDLKQKFQKDYKEVEELPENTKDEVHEKEQAYQEFKQSTLYQQLKQLANIHTRQYFEKEADSSDYENYLLNIGASDTIIEEEDWFKSAQQDGEQRRYFHWQLEFPKVFFGNQDGFDAVVGNPPYVKIQNIPEDQRKIFEKRYEVAKERYDLYGLFVERCNHVSKDKTGLILPNKFFEARAGRPLRNFLKETGCVESIVDFNQFQVFEDVTTYTCLLFLSKSSQGNIIQYKSVEENAPEMLYSEDFVELDLSQEEDKWSLLSIKERSVVDKTENTGKKLSQITDQIQVGVQTSANTVFILKNCKIKDGYIHGYSKELDKEVKVEKGITKPFVTDKDVQRYGKPDSGKFLIYPYNSDGSIIQEENLKEKYPEAYDYLQENKDKLSSRGSESQVFEKWYAHWCPRHPSKFERSKVVIAQVAKGGKCTYDSEGDTYFSSMVYSPIFEEGYEEQDKAVLGILNSSLVWHYIQKTGTVLRGGYYRYKTDYLEPVGIPVDENLSELRDLVEEVLSYKKELEGCNTNIEDYLINYDLGETLGDLYKPASGVGNTVVAKTTEDKEKLQVERAEVRNECDTSVLLVSARYKPENKAAFDTDGNGYTETDLIPVMEFRELSEQKQALLEEYVPIAIENEMNGFRDNATKTNTLLDRLKDLQLPRASDVSEDLKDFVEEREKAKELQEKIEDKEKEINQVVYDLYDLTEEEIETVEEAI